MPFAVSTRYPEVGTSEKKQQQFEVKRMKTSAWFRLLLLIVVLLAAPASPLVAEGEGDSKPVQKAPDQKPADQKPADQKGPDPKAATLKIDRIAPGAPILAPNQPLTLTGSNFGDKVTMKFTDPEGKDQVAQVLRVTSEQVVAIGNFYSAGSWKVRATNPDATFAELPFQVANTPVPDYASRIAAYDHVSFIVTILLVVLFGVTILVLIIVQLMGRWSLGDALSEECDVQPKEIRQKSDVIMVASSSRLIALLGLLGILTTVVGIGYAIVWNLFLYGTVPDLSNVRSFLFGAACLFAPYLANQLSGVFGSSSSTKPQAAPDPVALGIGGIGPASPDANAAGAQPISLTGTGFQTGLKLAFTDPAGQSHEVSGAAITAVHPTLVNCNVTLAIPGPWQVTVQNPPDQPSAPFKFTVIGAPAIAGTNPAALTHGAGAQDLTLTGTGFMSGVTVALTPAGGGAPVPTSVKTVSSTTVELKVTVATAGAWQIVATNPQNKASAPGNLTVN
jgi:hypothetical protein